ncbi:hypothetical protein F5Y18DRAFT_421965 [Xylariaceae sp. FL1019]|nr:hypothetical protein F5Y18DRAFT_421965 [Xylariaceae sp. FL1019]
MRLTTLVTHTIAGLGTVLAALLGNILDPEKRDSMVVWHCHSSATTTTAMKAAAYPSTPTTIAAWTKPTDIGNGMSGDCSCQSEHWRMPRWIEVDCMSSPIISSTHTASIPKISVTRTPDRGSARMPSKQMRRWIEIDCMSSPISSPTHTASIPKISVTRTPGRGTARVPSMYLGMQIS